MIPSSPDDLYEELFDDVQTSGIFADSKTFCDAVARQLTPNEILHKYREEKKHSDFNLISFVNLHFLLPCPPTLHVAPRTIVEHCQQLWPLLTRNVSKENSSAVIPVPHPFVVPGGRFQEFYYWDTYFTMLGLLQSNQVELYEHMLANFAYLIRTIGHIPNGNCSYYRGRSQPPFFILMTELMGKTDQYRAELQLEYQFWMTKRVVQLDDGTVLNRYFDDLNTKPRPEAYHEDKKTALAAKNRSEIYLHLRAAAESGWDFSSRWLKNENDLTTIVTAEILPVDLNCLLYHLELKLGKTVEAERRRQAIFKYFWSDELQFFTDFNFIEKKSTHRLTLAGLFPLWLDICTAEQGQAVARQIESLFLHDGGLVTTIVKDTRQQWDHPNGWAPLQWIAYRSLLKTSGYEKIARTIRQRWMSLIERVFAETGKMMEKYDVVHLDRPAGGGEYQNQDGFGWTNGVYLAMLYDKQTE